MLPRLTQAHAPLTCPVQAVNEHGQTEDLSIPAERALTVYVDKRELVTLMTLGAHPEWLVLGYLRNQRLIDAPSAVESITVDWDAGEGGAGVAAVKTHGGIADLSAKTAQRVVTTGCGQGSMFGDLLTDLDGLSLPAAQWPQEDLYAMVDAIRLQESTYKSAGSVHACALFHNGEMKLFVEDVGRHKIVRASLNGQEINLIAAEGAEISADMNRVVFDPAGINVYRNDWRVAPQDKAA